MASKANQIKACESHRHLLLVLGDHKVVGLQHFTGLLLLLWAGADHRHLLPKALHRCTSK